MVMLFDLLLEDDIVCPHESQDLVIIIPTSLKLRCAKLEQMPTLG